MESNGPEAWPNVLSVDEVYTFDPNGDIILQLVCWPQRAVRILRALLSIFQEKKSSMTAREAVRGPGESPSPESSARDTPLWGPQPPDVESVESQPLVRTKGDECPGGRSTRALQPTEEEEPAYEFPETVYLRVSSTHLVLASAMFKTMLTSDAFPEGRTLRSEGTLVVKLSDDLDALIILMNVVHGKTRKVPRHVPLHTLADLAHLVNYYQLHEAVELFSDTWITSLKQETQIESYDPELVLPWLFISWVFQKGSDFQKMTRILIWESDDTLGDEIEGERVPIPASITKRIQELRIEAITRTVTVVHDYITTYLDPNILCTNAKVPRSDLSYDSYVDDEPTCFRPKEGHRCDAVILGSLLKCSAAIGIWPRPEIPYQGVTFQSLASQVRKMEVLDTCTPDEYYGGSRSHGIKDAIEASIRSLEDEFCGFELAAFLPGAQGNAEKKQRKKKTKNKGQGKGALEVF